MCGWLHGRWTAIRLNIASILRLRSYALCRDRFVRSTHQIPNEVVTYIRSQQHEHHRGNPSRVHHEEDDRKYDSQSSATRRQISKKGLRFSNCLMDSPSYRFPIEIFRKRCLIAPIAISPWIGISGGLIASLGCSSHGCVEASDGSCDWDFVSTPNDTNWLHHGWHVDINSICDFDCKTACIKPPAKCG